jgi:putative redox protein
MDALPPIGNGEAMTPKQLLIAGLCGCTAMDVLSLLKKHRQPLDSFEIEATVEKSEGVHPVVFTSALLKFILKGNLDEVKVIEAVTLSQTKFCGVSAMLSKAFPIRFTVELNGKTISDGSAHFSA